MHSRLIDFSKILLLISIILLIFIPVICSATKEHTEYIKRVEVTDFIKDLHKESGIPIKKLTEILSKATKVEKSLQLISNPKEVTCNWREYKNIFINSNRINKGIDFWDKNEYALNEIEKNYGIPAKIILGILGVETYYGKFSGDFKVLDVLVTLGFDYPKRKKFFQKELKHFLTFTYEQGINPEKITGSYAGAMGMPQFMPSSYRSYATSFSKGNTPDIWLKDHDSIASIANYMKKHGWKPGELVALKIITMGTMCEEVISNTCECKYSINYLKKIGWQIENNINDDAKVIPMKHDVDNGSEFWVGFHNFSVITKYNKSLLYALAVYQLSEEINNVRQSRQNIVANYKKNMPSPTY